MASDEIILGIDLGTTFSVVAYVDEQGNARVIRNAEGEKTTPSAVLIEDGKVQVGSVALNQAIVKKDNVIQWIKRSIGDLDYQFEGMGPIEISAEILKKLKADAELELGIPLKKAVITCPAYFSAIEVENTMKAGQAAQIDVQEIVREPTAAAVYYGVEHLNDGEKLLVCDLGGGTYDASILTLENGIFKPLSIAGDRQLGGHDWTSDILEHAAELLGEQLGEDPRIDPAIEQTLYESAERVKRNFARIEQDIITCVLKGKTAQITITRNDFEQMTEWRIEQLLMWTEMALKKATPPLSWQQIDHILLVGGATRMRRVSEALKEISGREPIQTAEADTMVALGAAILAKGAYKPKRKAVSNGIKKHKISGLTLINFTRTAPRNLGTKVIVKQGRALAIENSVIIPYGTNIPTEKKREDYLLSAENQTFFDIPVVEFDDIGPEVIQDTWRFQCPKGLQKGTLVHVTFQYDKSGQINVEAVEQQTKKVLGKKRVVYEEPDLQAVTSPPRCVVFALDVSGSMSSGNKIGLAKLAVIDNSRQLIDKGGSRVRIGVVVFGSYAETVCPLTNDINNITSTVSNLDIYGTTAMGQGINLAISLLSETSADTIREIVLVSDGMPDDEDEALSAGSTARANGINLWLLGIGHEEVDKDFLNRISPNYLVIDSAESLSQDIANLLTQSTPSSGGITWLQ